jgi:tryptophan-rich sensory protein
MTEIASPGQLRAAFLRWVLFLVPGILLLGFLSGRWAGSGPDNPWFAALVKPGIYPPPVTFGVVWSMLYVLMALALALVVSAQGARGRGVAVALFLLQLGLNLAWTPLFFGAHRIVASLALLAGLDVLVVITVAAFARVRPRAALLMLPYLGWVLFATVLNWQFLALNPDADGQQDSGAVVRLQIGS